MSSATSFRDMLGAPKSTASPKDSVLVIIDAQNEYAQGNLKTKSVESTRKSIASLLEKWRAAGQSKHVVHVVHQVPDGAPVFTPGTELAEEFQELSPREGEKVIKKQQPSSFAGTGLDEHLKGLGDAGKKPVFVGYMAHVCVSTTTRVASELGYEPVLVREAIGDRDIPGASGEEVTKMTLLELGDAFGTVIAEGEVKA